MNSEQWYAQVLAFLPSFLSSFSLTFIIVFALVLDFILGEPKKYHYLIGFGNTANRVESQLNQFERTNKSFSKLNALLGGVAWCILVLPICWLSYYVLANLPLALKSIIEIIILYMALGMTSLQQHAMQVYTPLQRGDLDTARHYTGYLVSRDTSDLSPEDMSRATVESMLENGHDAVIASLIYFIIGGIPLVILHRLSNTLDAMWGYKTQRFNAFGYFSARADDVLGFVTGKICTLLYALQRPFIAALKNAYQQGNQYKSHNGGWVMAAGATVMNRTIGGNASYHGRALASPHLGQGDSVGIDDIPRSVNLVRVSAVTLALLVFTYQLVSYFLS